MNSILNSFSQKKNALRMKPIDISVPPTPHNTKDIESSVLDHMLEHSNGTERIKDCTNLMTSTSSQTIQSPVTKYKSKLVVSVSSDHPLTKHSYLGHWFAELTKFITTGAKLRGYSVDVTIEADTSPDLPEF
jgi:hypothetical protein